MCHLKRDELNEKTFIAFILLIFELTYSQTNDYTAEMPELNGLKEKYGYRMNFIVLTENTCKDDDLIKFLEKHPFNYHILQNAENYKNNFKNFRHTT